MSSEPACLEPCEGLVITAPKFAQAPKPDKLVIQESIDSDASGCGVAARVTEDGDEIDAGGDGFTRGDATTGCVSSLGAATTDGKYEGVRAPGGGSDGVRAPNRGPVGPVKDAYGRSGSALLPSDGLTKLALGGSEGALAIEMERLRGGAGGATAARTVTPDVIPANDGTGVT